MKITDSVVEYAARGPGGTRCPTCSKHVQVYRRRLHSGMVRFLIEFYRYSKEHREVSWVWPWVHIDRQTNQPALFISGDYSKLTWWGLIEPDPENEALAQGGKSAGRWRMTDKGAAFARGECSMFSHAFEYMSRVIEFDGDPVSASDCLGKRFDYHALMEGTL